jgi:hypothetical protein
MGLNRGQGLTVLSLLLKVDSDVFCVSSSAAHTVYTQTYCAYKNYPRVSLSVVTKRTVYYIVGRDV